MTELKDKTQNGTQRTIWERIYTKGSWEEAEVAQVQRRNPETPFDFEEIDNKPKTELATVELVSDFFRFIMEENSKFYIYDVKFAPEQENKAKAHKLVKNNSH